MRKIILSILFLLMPLSISHADSLDKPMFAYGESLTDVEIEQTKKDLNVKENSDSMIVHISEMNNLLQDNYKYDQVYSSVYIEPNDLDGIKTTIVTPNTITVKTEAQYTNAAITAGANNVNIRVSSVKPVDGSGALAGLYKAYEEKGIKLNKENIKVAQEELDLLSSISTENISKKGFTDEQFNKAIAEIKKQIIEVKKENLGESLDENKVRTIVINVINNYELNEYITEEQINSIVNLMMKFQNIKISPEQIKELTNLGKGLFEKGVQVFKDAGKTWENIDEKERPSTSERFSNFFKPIKRWIDKIIEKTSSAGLK